ncbi:MAG TPA: hypothetical protein VLE89_07665 [Chlamydiales bacterium]|nr:hypothetical protein [Chlamydiales bacterium]
MITFFIAIQVVLFFFMILHDWIDLPPFTDLEALKKAHTFKFRLIGSVVNGALVLIPLAIVFFFPLTLWARLVFVGLYGLMTFGTITAWWIPYFGGGYLLQGNKAGFEEYRNTHSFLPPRGDNVVPNTLHVLLHLQVWICFGISLYLLFA